MAPFDNALSQLNRVAAARETSPKLLARMSSAERELRISIPVTMDDGSEKIFEGYRVQHSSLRGPYKGGIRFHQDTDINEVRALALWMTMKCAVSGIPMGGSKGGVTVNPKLLSKGELERLSRGWVKRLYPVLGPKVDVPAPDVNTTPEIMSWMADEYAKLTGDNTKATFTGKPLNDGGSEGRGAATGMGGFYVFEALREKLGLPVSCSIAIQGMGNVGLHAAKIFTQHGHKVVAISDSSGGIFNQDGLDISAVEQYKKEHKALSGCALGKSISNNELLELTVDLLIPSALENQITAANATAIEASVVLELANGPTTPEADDVLFARGISVVPDILANAGGVVVSTFEWEQNLTKAHWSEEQVFEKLRAVLNDASETTFNRSKDLSTDLRRGAFAVALDRIESVM